MGSEMCIRDRNGEAKMAAVQSASQKRIQHIARRFAETGIKRLCKGLNECSMHTELHLLVNVPLHLHVETLA